MKKHYLHSTSLNVSTGTVIQDEHNNNDNNNNSWTIFMVLSSYLEHCESSPSSCGDCSSSASGRRTLDQGSWPKPFARLCSASKLHSPVPLLLLSPKADWWGWCKLGRGKVASWMDT